MTRNDTGFRILLVLVSITAMLLCAAGVVQGQQAGQPADQPTGAGPSPAPPAVAPAPSLPTGPEGISPEQMELIKKKIKESGGELTPEALKALKERPEFKGLGPEEIQRGLEMIKKEEAEEKKPAEVKEEVKKEEVKEEAPEKVEEVESLFERYTKISKPLQVDTHLTTFGYDFFKKAEIRPVSMLPVSSEYVVGPGDEIKVLMWGRVNAQYNLVVDREGKISMPQIGPLTVAGMKFARMKKYVEHQARRIIGANVSVTMGRLRSIQVFVLGEVKKPGVYSIHAMSTITDALMAAGGPSQIGSLRQILLKRGGKTISILDFYDLLLKGDKSKDKVLQEGDVVFVKMVGPLVGIAGNVRRPAVYELRGATTLLSAIQLAGGLLPAAYSQHVQVERFINNEKQIVLDVNAKETRKIRSFKLRDGDLVKVFPIVDRNVNAVYLYGNVKRPGKYQFRPGMRVRDLINAAESVLPETYFDYALVKRLVPPTYETKLVPFNLGRALASRKSGDNIPLQPLDSVYVFPIWFFKERPYVVVRGQVRKPGKFKLFKNMTVKDAIMQAGGLTDDAYLKKAEIIRVGEDRGYSTIYFDLEKALEEDPSENIALADEDQIVVHSLWEEKWKEFVEIKGEIKKPDRYILTKGMTVKDLVFKAGGITRNAYMREAELYRTDWRTKETRLIRFNLDKALAGDPKHNLALQDLDRIVVHSIWEVVPRQTVSVEGQVNRPGAYPYTVGMTVSDLIFAAGNLKESAYLEEAELAFRVVEKGKGVVKRRTINLEKALKGDPKHNLKLEPYCHLFVKKIPEWLREDYATISGEVRFPGKYILKKGETLSSLIERAGGYTEAAYLRGAVFTRESVRQQQQRQLSGLVDRLEKEFLSTAPELTAVSPETLQQQQLMRARVSRLLQRLRTVKATGRLAIRLKPLKELRGSPDDIELQNGDSIYIPPVPKHIQILGAVNNPGAYLWHRGRSVESYLRLAGGLTDRADRKGIYILRADGTAVLYRECAELHWDKESFRWTKSATLDPGDSIMVPEQIERISYLAFAKDLTQILYQIAVTAGVLIVAF